MPLPILTTERLLIRPYAPTDAAARQALMTEAFGPVSPAEIERWLAWTLANYDALDALHQPPYGDYAITLGATGEAIGGVGLVPAFVPWGACDPALAPNDPARTRVSAEFGLFWALRSAHRGQGYAVEAARAVVDWLWNDFPINGVTRIVATTEYDNAASQAVMRRLGMTIRRSTGGEPVWFQVVGVLER